MGWVYYFYYHCYSTFSIILIHNVLSHLRLLNFPIYTLKLIISFSAIFFETSSKDGMNIADSLVLLARYSSTRYS